MLLSYIIKQNKGESRDVKREVKYVHASQKGQEICTENKDICLHQICI